MSHATCRQELVEWAAANGRLPSINKIDSRADENLLGHKLYRLRRTYRAGNAKLHHLELLLSLRGALEGDERAIAEHRRDELRAREEAATLEKRAKIPVDVVRWDASFAELQEWVTATGSLPRRRTKDTQEYKVANWLKIQRTHACHMTLSLERVTKLRTIPGALEPKAKLPSSQRIADVAAFQSEHGRLPSSTALDAVESSLGHFLHNIRLRLRTGYLSAELTAVLTAEASKIPDFFTGPNYAAANLQKLQSYVATHGHMPLSKKDKSLYSWYLDAIAGRSGGREAASIQAAVLEIRATYPTRNVWRAVSRFEAYVSSHGHRPPESRTHDPRFREAPLNGALTRETTPEPVKERIRAILTAPAYREGAPCRLGDGCQS